MSFPSCGYSITMGQQRPLERLLPYFCEELTINLLMFLHVVLRQDVQPRNQCRPGPHEKWPSALDMLEFHRYGNYLASSREHLKPPAVNDRMHRFKGRGFDSSYFITFSSVNRRASFELTRLSPSVGDLVTLSCGFPQNPISNRGYSSPDNSRRSI